ncbi:50S ribosomal protein L35 [Heracleum sosnowskyi]|uniref:50S ribosomal protein L35 n=1 Tax=Heracleum sosnowskyi TaxID=360622 RepID=A0AAD8N7S1_9APIA|nr:50S ribosomal protein L35 [Heracleum sosnowskyi]
MFNFVRTTQVHYKPGSDEEDGHFRKRYKISQQPQHSNYQDWSSRSIQFPVPAAQFNPLDEPSPLGLKLKKSPSFLDLIQRTLSGANASFVGNAPGGNSKVEEKKDVRTSVASSSVNKLKASKILASFLRIGSWKYVSRREGDLVAKCYYSKQKLVWEILDCGLKSKIEFQWSDIVFLNASCPDDKPGNLTLVLSRPPLFFKESDPQPRKHTLWQATADFTDGQASMQREHFLQCPQGVLNKHYEKLMQCDMRLKCLSQQSNRVMHAPFFVSPACGSQGDIPGNHLANQLVTAKVWPMSSVALPLSSSSNVEQMGTLGIAPWHQSKEASSPSSGAIEANEICEGQGFPRLKNHELSKVSGLHQSMSVNDLLNHIEHHISEQMTSGETPECKDILDNIAHHFLNDTQTITAFDEKSLMSRVNSLCSLLQDRVEKSNGKPDGETNKKEHNKFQPESTCNTTPASLFEIGTMGHEKDITDYSSCKQPNMHRSDSFGDLLLHLQRSSSLQNFIAKVLEDSDNHT